MVLHQKRMLSITKCRSSRITSGVLQLGLTPRTVLSRTKRGSLAFGVRNVPLLKAVPVFQRCSVPMCSYSSAPAFLFQIYAIGAGIAAAAGTRLALQLILTKGFKFYSFQSQDMDALYCYFLSLPPCVRIG